MNKVSYPVSFCIMSPIVHFLWPFRIKGMEHTPKGAAIVCANHQSNLDPVLIAMSFGNKFPLRFMGKKELFDIPILKSWLNSIGAFPINRSEADIVAIRTAMKYLKSGDKIMMFPEGTRVSPEESVAAKTGAVRIASKMHVPILPVYVKSKHRVWHFSHVYVGEPYYPEAPHGKEDYAALSQELMDRIYALEPKE